MAPKIRSWLTTLGLLPPKLFTPADEHLVPMGDASSPLPSRLSQHNPLDPEDVDEFDRYWQDQSLFFDKLPPEIRANVYRKILGDTVVHVRDHHLYAAGDNGEKRFYRRPTTVWVAHHMASGRINEDLWHRDDGGLSYCTTDENQSGSGKPLDRQRAPAWHVELGSTDKWWRVCAHWADDGSQGIVAILFSCRRIYNEAMKVFFDFNTLYCLDPYNLGALSRAMSPDRFQNLHSLDIPLAFESYNRFYIPTSDGVQDVHESGPLDYAWSLGEANTPEPFQGLRPKSEWALWDREVLPLLRSIRDLKRLRIELYLTGANAISTQAEAELLSALARVTGVGRYTVQLNWRCPSLEKAHVDALRSLPFTLTWVEQPRDGDRLPPCTDGSTQRGRCCSDGKGCRGFWKPEDALESGFGDRVQSYVA